MSIEVTDLERGYKVQITGDVGAECYCAKSHEVPQAVKDVLAVMFQKPEPKRKS